MKKLLLIFLLLLCFTQPKAQAQEHDILDSCYAHVSPTKSVDIFHVDTTSKPVLYWLDTITGEFMQWSHYIIDGIDDLHSWRVTKNKKDTTYAIWGDTVSAIKGLTEIIINAYDDMDSIKNSKLDMEQLAAQWANTVPDIYKHSPEWKEFFSMLKEDGYRYIPPKKKKAKAKK